MWLVVGEKSGENSQKWSKGVTGWLHSSAFTIGASESSEPEQPTATQTPTETDTPVETATAADTPAGTATLTPTAGISTQTPEPTATPGAGGSGFGVVTALPAFVATLVVRR